MDLKTYLKDRAGLHELAAAIGCNAEYLWQIATKWEGRQASPKMAVRIETATRGKVTRADLRPDLWSIEPKRKVA